MFTQLKTTLIVLALATPAFAQGPSRTPAQSGQQPAVQQGQNDKMDVGDLEKKYWAAKDSDFNVVQNRTYSKANRLALTLNYGMFTNDPFSSGPTYGVGLNYFFSERYGIELNYNKTDSKDNESTAYIKANQGSAPDHNKMKGYYGVGFNWVPFYAKMSFLNSSIIYFDMSFTPGVGIMQYQQQLSEGNVDKTAPAVSIAVTQHFFVTKWLAIRLDYKNFWSQQDVISYQNNANRRTTNKLQNDSLLMGGLTFYF